MTVDTAGRTEAPLWQRMWAANPLVAHWKPWMVMQKGVVLAALGLLYGATWLFGVAAPFAIVGAVAFFTGWGRDVVARGRSGVGAPGPASADTAAMTSRP